MNSPGQKRERVTRREALACMGFATAVTALSNGLSSDAYAAMTPQERQAKHHEMEHLAQQTFRIRIHNNYQWPIRFVLCSMQPNVHHRVDVNGNGGTYQSGQEMYGGHRVAIANDEFAGMVLDHIDLVLQQNVTFTIDNNGRITWG